MPRNVTASDPLVDPLAAWVGASEPPVALEPGPPAACPSGHSVAGGAKFCPECGQAMAPPPPTAPWTDASGHTVSESMKFCPECGDARPDLRAPVAGAGVIAEMAARVSSIGAESFRPKPASELTPEELAERERLHLEAVRMGQTNPPVQFEIPKDGAQTVLIHITSEGEGFTCFGQVWHRGQELELVVGSVRWQEAQRWINMSDSQQMERYNGRVMFRHGPWPGARSYTAALADGGNASRLMSMDGSKTEVGGPTLEDLQRADQQEAARGRRVPARSI